MVLRYVGPDYTFEQQRVEINNLATDVVGLAVTPAYSTTAGYATISGYSTSSGVSTSATTAGYATTAGISTLSQGLTGTPNIVVGVSTLGVVSATSVNATGIITANSFRPSSGYYQSPNGTNAFYVFDTSGDVSFQGKIVTNYIRSNTNLNPTITVSDLDLQFARNVTISGITTSTGGFVGNLTGTATTATTAGYATTAGIATVAQGLTGTPNIVVGVATVTGNLNAPGNYYVKLARLTNQAIPINTDTLIGFTATSDTNGWYSGITTRTTPTVAGTYRVDVMMNISAGSVTNNQTNIQLRKNGSTFAISQVGIQTFQYTMNACGIVTMNGTTDYIEFSVYTGNPGGQTVTGTADGAWTKMEVFKIN